MFSKGLILIHNNKYNIKGKDVSMILIERRLYKAESTLGRSQNMYRYRYELDFLNMKNNMDKK